MSIVSPVLDQGSTSLLGALVLFKAKVVWSYLPARNRRMICWSSRSRSPQAERQGPPPPLVN